MIKIDRVSRTFTGRSGTVEALHEVSLQVADGEFVAVVGRSGCGKSTLLRMIAGLLPPTGGVIEVGGAAVAKPRRDVSMMFQRPALLPWRSVLDNVLLPVQFFGKRKSDYRERAQELLVMTGLNGFEKRLPHELSGGMQQRVALCRALIAKPQVMLMDEPFSALDPLIREELSGELQRIHMEQRATTVFVTHSIDEAVLLADRVVVLSPRPGRVREIVDVRIPRPRTLGRTAHSDEVARCSGLLHDLLMA
ncbi:ABC transporter ATP-binding protein [Paractinoplanes brasiliensis]|uniref:NitT/TauT family transport system ATP-binding protein n=1 Tax=Paractinoplanes brasiliensis TaxID=52695 RepID=A0A4R6JQB1_9ACTN|nr:ABC transporter ATP-binding protein [Actinoplanes brasiliensis]TDO38763.1 NitT/TauT family transport system ATP-binding protein [Actinoplanes brasiliensis]GID26459.1 ABC transporter ATP-binding protein [Actinoplanes brasiliensis]